MSLVGNNHFASPSIFDEGMREKHYFIYLCVVYRRIPPSGAHIGIKPTASLTFYHNLFPLR